MIRLNFSVLKEKMNVTGLNDTQVGYKGQIYKFHVDFQNISTVTASLFHLTATICPFVCLCGRLDEWTKLIRQTSRQEVTACLSQAKYCPCVIEMLVNSLTEVKQH